MASAFTALLAALAGAVEALTAAGAWSEIVGRWRAERLRAEEAALAARDERRRSALAAGDVRQVDADLVDLELELGELLQGSGDSPDRDRRD